MRDYPNIPLVQHKKAIFLDRDGTINIDTHYPHKLEDCMVPSESIEGMKLLSTLPFDLLVITNQSGISLGYYKKEDMSFFNQEVKKRVEEENGRIDAFYYCPHFEKKNARYKEDGCSCTKPKPGMLFEARNDYAIDFTKSYFIGDKITDIECGKSVGCTTILIKTNDESKKSNEHILPDYMVKDLFQAAKLIENLEKR